MCLKDELHKLRTPKTDPKVSVAIFDPLKVDRLKPLSSCCHVLNSRKSPLSEVAAGKLSRGANSTKGSRASQGAFNLPQGLRGALRVRVGESRSILGSDCGNQKNRFGTRSDLGAVGTHRKLTSNHRQLPRVVDRVYHRSTPSRPRKGPGRKLPKGPLRYPLGTAELGNETTSNHASAYLASLGCTGFPKMPTRAASLGFTGFPKNPPEWKARNSEGPRSFSGETGIGGLRWLELPKERSNKLGCGSSQPTKTPVKARAIRCPTKETSAGNGNWELSLFGAS